MRSDPFETLPIRVDRKFGPRVRPSPPGLVNREQHKCAQYYCYDLIKFCFGNFANAIQYA